jgi:hypothetical protein
LPPLRGDLDVVPDLELLHELDERSPGDPLLGCRARDRLDAAKDSDFFANQNSVVKLTYRYTLQKLLGAFGLEDPAF